MRLLVALLSLVAVSIPPVYASGELSGRRAPGFSLTDRNMKFHDLADYRGKVVVLEVMRTQCPNCQKLAQTLEKIKIKYGDRIAVLSVVNPPDNAQTVTAFEKQFHVSGPILFDCGQMVGSYLLPDPKRPRIHVPHLFLIDQEGMIRNDFDHTSTTVFEGPALEKKIDRLLE